MAADVYILIPGMYKYITLYGKGEFTDVIMDATWSRRNLEI